MAFDVLTWCKQRRYSLGRRSNKCKGPGVQAELVRKEKVVEEEENIKLWRSLLVTQTQIKAHSIEFNKIAFHLG